MINCFVMVNTKKRISFIRIFTLSILLTAFGFVSEARVFKVASYNVETLFDFTNDGTEFIEYIPNNRYGWTRKMADIKTANIAQVIKDMNADIVMLQEVESKKSLFFLQSKLKNFQADYPYCEIADYKTSTMKCAVLSKFPIIEKKEIQVNHEGSRNILKIILDIYDNRLILFINHWKSKRKPESHRIASAKSLKREIDKLKDEDDFLLAGDFNSDYNEYKTFKNSERLNDTGGITGINHVLKTIKNFEMVDEHILTAQITNKYLYNLWLEIDKKRRWSHNFFGKKNSLDSIIVSKALYDDKGISYVDNSFDKFDPDYLFKDKGVYNWKRAQKGQGKHLGEGYSDHLPIFAWFSTEPFFFQKKNPGSKNNPVSSGKAYALSQKIKKK